MVKRRYYISRKISIAGTWQDRKLKLCQSAGAKELIDEVHNLVPALQCVYMNIWIKSSET